MSRKSLALEKYQAECVLVGRDFENITAIKAFLGNVFRISIILTSVIVCTIFESELALLKILKYG